jgi:hypothetical protein
MKDSPQGQYYPPPENRLFHQIETIADLEDQMIYLPDLYHQVGYQIQVFCHRLISSCYASSSTMAATLQIQFN